jgi:uncharacterized oxidoreductase
MKTTQNTVLITGGSAGIGFEIAKLFSENGNHVIITGRNEERLKQAAAQLKNVTAIPFDVTKEEDVNTLVSRLAKEFPSLNVVVNNAGHATMNQLTDNAGAWKNAEDEMFTNYISIIRLNEKLFPLLGRQPEAAIVNVSSIVALAPIGRLTTYAASKAALHSYTQSLRVATASSSVEVFELMPPLVNTEFSKEIGGANGIPPSQVAAEFFKAFANNVLEIHVASTADFYRQFHSEALKSAVSS